MDVKELCRAVERKAKQEVGTPAEFEWLAGEIERATGARLSESTLMRLWGYREGVKPRRATLDILA